MIKATKLNEIPAASKDNLCITAFYTKDPTKPCPSEDPQTSFMCIELHFLARSLPLGLLGNELTHTGGN